MRHGILCCVALAWAAASPAMLSGQWVPDPAFPPTFSATAVEAAGSRQARDAKSPLVAALLNGFLLPGAGNFYAGHPGHGFRHVGLHFAGLYLVFSSVTDEGEGPLFEEDREWVAVSGVALATANLIWSIFTGIEDARAAGPPAQRTVAALKRTPWTVLRPVAPRRDPWGPRAPRVVLQLLRLNF